MKVFAISDLHLSTNCNKPMDIFGGVWDNYFDKIVEDWQSKVNDEDIVLIAGDISWAMKLDEAKSDLDIIGSLKGKKIMIRGNHDYWWKSLTSIREMLKTNTFILQNDAMKIGDKIFCGTRGWTVPEQHLKQSEEDKKIYLREIIRLELSLKQAKKLQTNGEDIYCLIHYPPFNSKLEDSEFTKLFEEYGVGFVIYGHLHGKEGRTVLNCEKNSVKYFLTSCDKVNNQLVEII